MKESDVGKFSETVIYEGVSKGGKKAWAANTKMRQQKVLRVVPAEYRTFDAYQRWPEYRSDLMKKAVFDPPFETAPAYCAYGDSFNVPGGVSKKIKKDQILTRFRDKDPSLQSEI
jgi:hypothetical protein